jgi:poly(A) polymerase
MFYPEFIKSQKLFVNEDLLHLFKIIEKHGGTLRFVGGFVRDTIAGYKHVDIDLVTDLSPTEFADICDDEGIKCIKIGLKFFSLGVIINDSFFKVTTLGLDEDNIKDVWKADAAQRDLTINAVYADDKGNVFDYFDGIKDLEKGVIKFIGNPQKAIERNYLHIMRFFRFCAMFGQKIDKKSLKACIENKKLLQQLSQEKIKEELFKIIMAPYAARALELVFKYGVLDFMIAPAKDLDGLRVLEELVITLDIERSIIRRIYVLFKPSIARANRLSSIFRLTKEQKEHLLTLCNAKLDKENFSDLKAINQSLYKYDRNICIDKFLTANLGNQNIEQLSKTLNTLLLTPRPIFPLTAQDFINLGGEKKFISVYMEALKNEWLESGCLLSKDELIEKFKLIFKYSV